MFKTLFFFLVLIKVIICQDAAIKQITNLQADCRNVCFLTDFNTSYSEPADFLFQVQKDTVTLIYSLKYNAEKDTFIDLTLVSGDLKINRNPRGNYYQDNAGKKCKKAYWETFINSSWDIVMSVDSGFGWTKPAYLAVTPADESEYSLSNPNSRMHWNSLLFTRNYSVYIFSEDLSSEHELFKGSDSIRYSNGKMYNDWDIAIAVAEVRIDGGNPQIAYRIKRYNDSDWTDIKLLETDTPAYNPKVYYMDYGIGLSFETLQASKRKVNWCYIYNLDGVREYFALIEDTSYETTDFQTLREPYYMTKQAHDYESLIPSTFRLVHNDSVFIRAKHDYYGSNYIFTKVKNVKPAVGLAGYYQNDLISYIIWEDSSNGFVNLFGIKDKAIMGDVDKNHQLSFHLSQNYPNPFNPITTIKYSIKERANVSLKVYDILGKEVATLVNEDKPAGDYEVTFDGSYLASGVYIYRMTSGGFTTSRKLLLLK